MLPSVRQQIPLSAFPTIFCPRVLRCFAHRKSFLSWRDTTACVPLFVSAIAEAEEQSKKPSVVWCKKQYSGVWNYQFVLYFINPIRSICVLDMIRKKRLIMDLSKLIEACQQKSQSFSRSSVLTLPSQVSSAPLHVPQLVSSQCKAKTAKSVKSTLLSLLISLRKNSKEPKSASGADPLPVSIVQSSMNLKRPAISETISSGIEGLSPCRCKVSLKWACNCLPAC